MANAFVQFRIDGETRREADRICARLGIDLATYMRISIAKLIEEEGVPFEMKLDAEKKPARAAKPERKAPPEEKGAPEPEAKAKEAPAAPARRTPGEGRRPGQAAGSRAGRAAGITDMSFD